MKTTAVVILNYNGRAHLEQFLPSVLEHTPEADIIIADNASSDDSLVWLAAQYPALQTIRLSHNYGFAEGYNRALAQLPHRFFVLLNSDVAVHAGWLSPLIRCLERDERVAACQPKILSYRQASYFEYAGAGGGFIDLFGIPFCRGRIFNVLEADTGQYDDEVPVFWASGACLCVRADDFRAVGGFDGDFFAHMEEIDLCWRLQTRGRHIRYCGTSTVLHLGGGTLAYDSPHKLYLNFRNGLLMLFKNLPAPLLLPLIFGRLCLDGLAAVFMTLQGKPAAIGVVFRAHFYLYRFMRYWYGKRQQTQAHNTLHDLPPQLYRSSIIWQYFFRRRKTYSALPR